MPAVRVPDLPEKVLLPDACHRGFLGHLSLPKANARASPSALRLCACRLQCLSWAQGQLALEPRLGSNSMV